jgi:predicted Zn-dependent protease with MMP-like domain
MALPDKIIIFQKPIESRCRSRKEIAEEVQRVVRHEIAHHFGFDDDSLRRIEGRKGNKKSTN